MPDTLSLWDESCHQSRALGTTLFNVMVTQYETPTTPQPIIGHMTPSLRSDWLKSQVDWLEAFDWLIRYNLFGMIWPHETLITPGTGSTHTWSGLTLLLILIPDHCANQYMWIYKDNPFMFLKTQYISWKVFLFFSHYSKPFRLAALIE